MIQKRLKDLRKANNLTQTELASHIKTSQQNIAKWEKGLSKPKYKNLKELSDFFSVSIEYLLGEKNNDTPDYTKIINLSKLLEYDLEWNSQRLTDLEKEEINNFIINYLGK